jgi:hypothetical protein
MAEKKNGSHEPLTVETSWDKVRRGIVDDQPAVNTTPRPVLQDWVMCLGVRLQGVLVSAIRGCDTAQRHDHTKVLSRVYRSEILRSFSGDPKKSKSFILAATIPETVEMMEKFLNDCDHLPSHFVMHFLHAAEILGYYHPDLERRDMWCSFYLVGCRKYHVRPEPPSDLIERLEKEEEAFHKDQDTSVTARLFDERVAKEKKAEAEEKRKQERVHGQYGGS